MRISKALKTFIGMALLGQGNIALANSLTLAAGYFTIDAKVGDSSGTISDLGSLRGHYWHNINHHFSLSAGYTVLFEDYGSGDNAYGLDLGGVYRPFNQQYGDYSSSAVSISVSQKWNPFVGVSFHQRQYQSISSAYSGLGVSFGTEYDFGHNFLLYGDMRIISLRGPVEGKATETSFNFGVTFLL